MSEMVRALQLGLQDYYPMLQRLKDFTQRRNTDTQDEIWTLEHHPVYTQGQAGKPEHILNVGNIPVVQSDRGGQVTYHGPGQLIAYLLTDIQRKNINIREFVCTIERSVIELLADYGIKAAGNRNAPGVYVNGAKICALGLRVRHGRTYHGLSLNVAMNLEPFTRINPCGYTGMQVVQISDLGGPSSVAIVEAQLLAVLTKNIGYQGIVNDQTTR